MRPLCRPRKHALQRRRGIAARRIDRPKTGLRKLVRLRGRQLLHERPIDRLQRPMKGRRPRIVRRAMLGRMRLVRPHLVRMNRVQVRAVPVKVMRRSPLLRRLRMPPNRGTKARRALRMPARQLSLAPRALPRPAPSRHQLQSRHLRRRRQSRVRRLRKRKLLLRRKGLRESELVPESSMASVSPRHWPFFSARSFTASRSLSGRH